MLWKATIGSGFDMPYFGANYRIEASSTHNFLLFR